MAWIFFDKEGRRLRYKNTAGASIYEEDDLSLTSARKFSGCIALNPATGEERVSDGSLWREPSHDVPRVLGFEVAEISSVTNTKGFTTFSGLKSARIKLTDEGTSSIARVYYVLNASSNDEAATKIALADGRLHVDLGESVTVHFDQSDPVVRIDYIANAAETGANLLYIEGRL